MLKRFKNIGLRILSAVFFAGLTGSVAYLSVLPDIRGLKTENPKETSFMIIRRGQAARRHQSFEPLQQWTPYELTSPFLRHAIIVAEDGRFYEHDGIDFEELKEAVKKNISKKRLAYGASTITQQLAKNLYLSPSKNPLRKIKEAIIAHRMEQELSKRRILEIYLNVIEWGPAVYGAQAASQYYFHKGADELTAEEAATLASYLPNPIRYSKPKYAKYVNKMTKKIIRRMKARGYLPDENPAGA
ncbi:MAG: monofunctional biosynthetic peptidoglycan transglycosylase [Elusimicrobia bacterium]|nr:monofunctional biosynthetic peptidoglycan transglycosylase [Elusimicrobiota bacterium]